MCLRGSPMIATKKVYYACGELKVDHIISEKRENIAK